MFRCLVWVGRGVVVAVERFTSLSVGVLAKRADRELAEIMEALGLSLIHKSEPTRHRQESRLRG